MKKNLIKILFLILCLFGYTNVCAKTPLYGDAMVMDVLIQKIYH